MHFFTPHLALIALVAPLIEAHTSFTTLFVNGESQGVGTCIRMNTDNSHTTSPIGNIESDDITCGYHGLQPVDRTCPINAGDTVSFRYQDWPGSDRHTSIVSGHSGPCAVYMKQMSTDAPMSDGSFPTESPAGDGWFKIMYDALDSNNQWCTERLNRSADGVISVKIPADVKSGYYLLRPELLALHAATQRDPQFYTGCAQVYINGGSGTANPETTSIPGYVNYDTPAMKYNIYTQKSGPYPEYGPKKYPASTSSRTKRSIPASEQSAERTNVHQSGSLISRHIYARRHLAKYLFKRANPNPFSCPQGTILELGNMCLPEAPHYQDSPDSDSTANCWASSDACWKIANQCWKNVTPAVPYVEGQGCYIMNARCQRIANQCENKVKSGPENEGKVLTPDRESLGGWGVMA